MAAAAKLGPRLASARIALLLTGMAVLPSLRAAAEPVVFSAIGDVPYSSGELADLEQHVLDHNLYSPSSFLVHLGDMLGSSESCKESRYQDVAGILLGSEVPVFIVPGDNEWVNCSSEDQGWAWWETHLLGLHEEFCFGPEVENQLSRPENFAFVLKDVLFIGINYVSGSPSSVTTASAEWVDLQFAAYGAEVRAVVVMAQRDPGSAVRSALEDNASAFGGPVLYIHGNGHSWEHEISYLGHANLVRVQVKRGTSSNPPVQVTVTDAGEFEFDRDPWRDGTPVARGSCSENSVLSIDDLFVDEGGSAGFKVSLAGANGGSVGVDYATEDDTARAGSDYEARSGRLSFSGATTEHRIWVPVLQDSDPEPGEAFFVHLSNAVGGVIEKAQGAAVVLDDDVTPSQHTLGTAIQGLGSIALQPPGRLYEEGSIATLTAIPASGYRFDGWSGAVSGRVNPAALVMDADKSVTARFTPIAQGDHMLRVTILGSGAVQLDPPGGAYAHGTTVTLTPLPSPGWRFVGWEGALGAFDDPSVRMDDDKTVAAVFAHVSLPPPVSLGLRVASDFEDAEEKIATGSVRLTSSDLELGLDRSNPQAVGLRFTSVPIPRGAAILGARLRFTTDETSQGAASLELRAQASDHASPFSDAAFDVSTRLTTAAVVRWNPADWSAVGAIQSTPDLSALLREVVTRPGWIAGNAMAFVVVGSGKRTAESYRGSPAGAALLEIVYRNSVDQQPPLPPAKLRSPVQTLTHIELVWEASADPDVVGYRLRGPSGSIDLADTRHVETGLVPDTLYDFQVSALDAAGNESSPTAPLGVRTRTPDRAAPSIPSNLRSPVQTLTTIELVWAAATDDVGVVGYRLHGPDWRIDVAGTSYVVTGLEEDAPYEFQVTARDAAGNLSSPSAVLRVRTKAPDREKPSVPQALVSPTQTTTAIELTWEASTDNVGVTGYRVYGPNGTTDVTGTSHVETGLEPNTLYDFQLSAFDARANESDPSLVLSEWTRAAPVALEAVVARGTDDAEERIATGSTSLGSGDLDLGEDRGRPQLVGLRFEALAIPQGAAILSARLQFAADEVGSGPAALVVRGEASGHATSFSTASGDLSARPMTNAAVHWTPAPWTLTGEAAAPQRTGDLAAVLQEVVNLSDWSAGNAMALLISGSGSRVAESHDGAAPPRLYVVYLHQPDREPPSAPPTPSSPSQTPTSIDLSWGAAIDDVGVTAYRVYGPNGTTDVAEQRHVEADLLPDTLYHFQVSALDAAGNESEHSPVLSVWTSPPDREAPSTPANLSSPAQTGATIELAWEASTDNVEVTGYRVYGPSGARDVVGTTYVESGLAPRSFYDFQVSAFDAAGNESEPTPLLNVRTGDAVPVSLSVVLAGDADDAEERIASGSLRLTSTDLELGEDRGNPQLVGLRFAGVSIPQGAEILGASVQFTADEVHTGPTSLLIRGEASGHAAPLAEVGFDLSARPTTSAAASWTPDPWNLVGDAGPAQRLDGLEAILQEIVQRPDWSPGNALLLLISGSGGRTAESYRGNPAAAAELFVDYLSP